jgi:CRISPR-associated Csx2 family protein
MAHVLFTFLGAGRQLSRASASQAPTASYQRTIYEFPGGTQIEGSLFGLALLQHLHGRAKTETGFVPPDKVVVLGTSGSAWDNLIVEMAGDRPDLTDLVALQAVPAVEPASLAPFLGLVGAALKMRHGIDDFALEVIPYAFETSEQISFIRLIASHVSRGTSMTFDVTNGFRHLPLVSVTAAAVVQRLTGAVQAGTWYGAHEHPRSRSQGITPVVRLDGLDHVGEWLDALAAFDADGSYGRFGRLLKRDGLPHKSATMLRDSDFREQIGDLQGAATKLRELEATHWSSTLTGPSTLFTDALSERIAWGHAGDAYGHFRRAAVGALEREDVMTCARFAHEAALTRITMQLKGSSEALKQEARTHAKDLIWKSTSKDHARVQTAFKELTAVRNVLVHTSYLVEERRTARMALAGPSECRAFLQDRIAILLPEDPMARW